MTALLLLALVASAAPASPPALNPPAQGRAAEPQPSQLQAAQLSAVQLSAAGTRFVLDNGLRVRVHVDRRRPVALVQVTYKVGSLHESAGLTGIAHFVEHMVYRATTNIRNEDVYGYIDRIGGRYTGGTWPEQTQYGELVPAWALESALRVTAERMTGARFDSLEFERERSNVIAETNGYADDDPVSALHDAVMQASFELHPYRYNSNTWARDNLALTRAQALAWYRRYYGPNNAVLTVVGDVEPDAVRRLVERHFAALRPAPESGEIRLVEPPQRAEKRVALMAPNAPRRVEIAYRAPAAAHPDFPALVVLNRVLRRRLATAFARTGHDTAFATADSASQYPWVYRISLRPLPGVPAESLLALVTMHVAGIAVAGVQPGEIEMARRDLAAPVRPGRQEQASAVPPRRSALSAIADSLTALEAEPWEVSAALRGRIAEATQRVTPEDVHRYARRWLLPSQRTVGILEPGPDDFEPRWSDDRPLAGIRPAIPALTVMPAPRERPEPVPARALRSLEPVQIPTVRRQLPNGVVIRAALGGQGAADAALRVGFSSAEDSAAVARALASALANALARHEPLRRVGGRVSWQRTDTAHAPGPRGPLTIAMAASHGSTTLEGLLRALSSTFGALPPRGESASSSRPHVPGEFRVLQPGEPQVAIVASLPGMRRDDPDRRALELLSYIVGVPSYGGRLGWALTKSGLTYSSAVVASFGASDGCITIRTRANPANADAVIQAITEVVQGVGEDGVREWELREAQAFMLGRALLYGAREDSDAGAVAAALLESELSRLELLDLPAFSRAYLDVTLAAVNRVARAWYAADRLRVMATGAVQAAERLTYPPGTFRALFDQ